MIVSQPALLCLRSFWNNVAGRTGLHAVQGEAKSTPAGPPPAALERAATIREHRLTQDTQIAPLPVEPGTHAASRWPALDAPVDESVTATAPASQAAPSGIGPLTANERRARAAALRALAFSRARRFDAAQIAFRDAATLDPELDLTRVPAFWTLERAAHEAAIAAYVEAGRAGDAAVLRAKVQSVYRPKPLRTRNIPVTT